MTEDTQPNIIALLMSDTPSEREQGQALAPSVESITLDGSTMEDVASANILAQLPKLTAVSLSVGEHTKGHLDALMTHLQQGGVTAETVQVSGDFGGPEWLDARHYSWTKYFQVDEIDEYISECESGSGLQFTFGKFTLAPIKDYDDLSALVGKLPAEMPGDDISFSRTNAGGSVYTCNQHFLQTVQFFWEEMNEESSEFDCCDWDEFTKFTDIIEEAGLYLSQGFFYNDWSGHQVKQEDWWFSEFEFPAAESITLSWAPSA